MRMISRAALCCAGAMGVFALAGVTIGGTFAQSREAASEPSPLPAAVEQEIVRVAAEIDAFNNLIAVQCIGS